MSATYKQAVDDILAVFRVAWATTAGKDIDRVIFPNIQKKVPAGRGDWARVIIKHLDGGQAAMGDDVKSYDRFGMLVVQIFISVGDGLDSGYALGKIMDDAYAGIRTPCDVWFRNGTIREIDPVGEFYQFNFSVEFEYNEVK